MKGSIHLFRTAIASVPSYQDGALQKVVCVYITSSSSRGAYRRAEREDEGSRLRVSVGEEGREGVEGARSVLRYYDFSVFPRRDDEDAMGDVAFRRVDVR